MAKLTEHDLVEQRRDMPLVAREQTEIQSAIVSAKHFPRNEVAASLQVSKSFARVGLAECARYQFPRGGKTITGPSVDCARELARLWGNMRYGIRIVSQTEDHVHIRGFAIDLETNASTEYEDQFKRLVQRKGRDGETRWIEPDERDLRELIGRRGAILVRNAILSLLPPDLVDGALQTADKTLRGVASGQLKASREDVVKNLASRFDVLGVSVAMLEGFLGHALADANADEVADLKAIGKSLADGMTKREDHFELSADTGRAAETPLERVRNRLKVPEGESKP
jgi:hypothetical protein